jgi:hypothetical protein
LFNKRDNVVLDSVVGKDIIGVEFQWVSDPAARRVATDQALAQASYAFLSGRYSMSRNSEPIKVLIDGTMNATGLTYDESSVGARVGTAVYKWALNDGACEQDVPQFECSDPARKYVTKNPDRFNPLWSGVGGLRDPSHWQRLKMGEFTDKSDYTVKGYPDFITPHWGFVRPFALRDEHAKMTVDGKPRTGYTTFDGVYFDPGPPPMWGPSESKTHAEFVGNHTTVAKCGSWLDVEDGLEWNVSPGNHALGSNNVFGSTVGCDMNMSLACANVGTGHEFNPATQEPYAANVVKRGDYLRVLSEFWERNFWQKGPDSDSPIRHWNWMLDNYVYDSPLYQFRWGGVGAPIDRQEFEVRSYLLLNGGFHDAGVAVWGIKRKYDSSRPVTALRFLTSIGQSTNKSAANYHRGAIPLIEGLSRNLQPEDICVGQCGNYSIDEIGYLEGPFKYLGFDNIGKTIIRTWRPTQNNGIFGVGWYMGHDWHTFRRPSFVTPPFAGYVSGHSTFARVAADTLTRITGDAFWPGGLIKYKMPKMSFFLFDGGVKNDVEMQWATYSDAADECSLSRVYVGAHIPHDDVPGRHIGRHIAQLAWQKLNTNTFFGVMPLNTRAAVRVRLTSEKSCKSQIECGAVLRTLALQSVGNGAPAPSRIQIVGRAPADPPLSRTVYLYDVPDGTAERLAKLIGSDQRFAHVDVLVCDELSCVVTAESGLSAGAGVGIAFAVIIILGCLAAVAYFVIRKKRAAASVTHA